MAIASMVGAAVLVVAYLERLAPPFPATAGVSYTITLDADGCPMLPEQPTFVDSPGELVPAQPVEVVLCSLPTDAYREAGRQPPVVPRQRVLTDRAPEFAAILNRLPDRNTAWRDWQRRHSGLWPDRPHAEEAVCLLMAHPYDHTYLLRYADRPSVALVSTCGTGGLTTGVRTRLDVAKPHVVDEFVRLLQT